MAAKLGDVYSEEIEKSEGKNYQILCKFSSIDTDEEFEKKLPTLECPFTWNMDSLANGIRSKEKDRLFDDSPYVPEYGIQLLSLMTKLLQLYVETKLEKQEHIGFYIQSVQVDVCLKYLRKINLEGVSLKAIEHIVDATKCHVLTSLGMKDDAIVAMNKVYDLEKMNAEDKYTLLGCRGIAWLLFHTADLAEGEKYIRLAIEGNPSCTMWNFVLGRYLKRLRISKFVPGEPTEEEKNCFLIVHDTTEDFSLKVFTGHLLFEYGEKQKALALYKQVYSAYASSLTLTNFAFLHLALGFIAIEMKSPAEKCLQRAMQATPPEIHCQFMGVFHRKFKQYQKAAKCLEKAIAGKNFFALEDYCVCMQKINRNFSVLQYLLSIMNTYGDCNEFSDVLKPRIYFHIAMEYYEKRNLPEALKYFHKSIKDLPRDMPVRFYSYIYDPDRTIDVYKILGMKILRNIATKRKSLDKKSLQLFEEIQQMYDEYESNKNHAITLASTAVENKDVQATRDSDDSK